MRKLNDMFHIDGERLVKSSNGEPVPDDEPVFIIRARDLLAMRALIAYFKLCLEAEVPNDRLAAMGDTMALFCMWRGRNWSTVKLPGVTHGR